MTALVAARILNGDGGTSASPAWLVMADGRIVATGTGAPPAGAIDLGDALLAPGFVDIQVNGAGAVDFARASVERDRRDDRRARRRRLHRVPARRSAARRSTRTHAMLERLAAVRGARPDAVLGVHLEGPFLGGAPGAHPRELVRPVDLEWLAGLVRPVRRSRAPRDARARGRSRSRRDRACCASAASSSRSGTAPSTSTARAPRPTPARASSRISSTAWDRCTTARPGSPAPRSTTARLVPSIIADGVHVHPAMVRLALARPARRGARHRRGRDGRRRSTHATAPRTSPTARSRDRRSRWSTRCATSPRSASSPAAAVRCATGNAARALGAPDHGRIAPGARADLVALDPGDARGAGRLGRAVDGRSRPSSVPAMEIVAALFVEGIDFRQVDGPSTRIDITGAFFSTAVDVVPGAAGAAPRRARARARRIRRQRHARDGVPPRRGEEIGRNRQTFFVEPGKFGYRLVKGELEFPEPGTIEALLLDRRRGVVGHSSAHRPAPAVIRAQLGRDRRRIREGMDLVNRYAAALSLHPTGVRGGRRGRGRDHRAIRRRTPRPASCCFASPHHVGAFEDVAGGLRKLLEPDVLIGCTAVGVAGGAIEVENGPGLSVFAARFGAGRVTGVALDAIQTDDGVVDLGLARRAARRAARC